MLRKEAIIVRCNWIKQLHTWLVRSLLTPISTLAGPVTTIAPIQRTIH
nr:MAG TPA: hypothetical protein [Caudoviricetes sp.]